MDAQRIKEYIIVNEKIEFILEELDCHSIKSHDNNRYITAGYRDGDNQKALCIYTDSLNVDSYTRDIEDNYGNSDIFSLVCFVKDMYFTQALKWVTDTLGIDYYNDEEDDIPESLVITRMLMDMMNGDSETEEEVKLKPIDEKILTYYKPIVNDLFYKDGVDYETQRLFEIGFDEESQRFTIPIRDELAVLVGVKGRQVSKDTLGEKYIYLERCAKSKILYGLHMTMEYIKQERKVFVVESEKSVLVLWSRGIRNVVAIGGHKLSKTQIEKLTRLGVEEVILCYDQDVHRMDNGKIDKSLYLKEANKFIPQIKVTAMVDLKGNILHDRESPVDDAAKFDLLYENKKVLQDNVETLS